MKTTNNNRTQKNIKLFVAFVLLVLSTTGAFAQTNTTNAVAAASSEVSIFKDAAISNTTDNAVASSMDFALWFMGTLKTSNNTSNSTSFSKKQLINVGIITNSVLIRSFLKKVSSQENGVA